MKKSYGFVEVHGLALAITVADAMVKSANVELVGTENANGIAWIQIKVMGDVGAVKAAVDVGSSLARKNNGLVAFRVIARPDAELVSLLTKAVPVEPVLAERVNEIAQGVEQKQSDTEELIIKLPETKVLEPKEQVETVVAEVEPGLEIMAETVKRDSKKNAQKRKRSSK